LLSLFPDREFDQSTIDRYNAQAAFEIERIRDFVILHFCATERSDTPFWDYCRTMSLPEPLANTIRLFRDTGRYYRNADELFGQLSWVQVMVGQRIVPRKYHPIVDRMSDQDLYEFVGKVEQVIKSCVDVMPSHQAFIDKWCKAPPIAM